MTLGIAIIYYYAPDAEQDWIWITPGSMLATLLWLLISLGFRFYVANFGAYTESYGAVGGVIIVMLWFYLSRPGHPGRRGTERRNRARLALRQGSGRKSAGREEEDRPARRTRLAGTEGARHASGRRSPA